MTSHTTLDSPDASTVAWISALHIERAAAQAMLDEEQAPPTSFTRHQTDANVDIIKFMDSGSLDQARWLGHFHLL